MRRKDISFLLAVVILVCFAGMGLSCSSGLKKHAAGELGLVYRNAPITREQMETWWKNAGENESGKRVFGTEDRSAAYQSSRQYEFDHARKTLCRKPGILR